MTACTLPSAPTPVRTPSRAARLGAGLARYFRQSVVTREAIDQAWIDSGLGRLDRRTPADIGAQSPLVDDARQPGAWLLAGALDATRLL
jgi:hypothetical protein